jgi:hypothetical protein
MKKKLLLLAGILVLGATTFAADTTDTPTPKEGTTIDANKPVDVDADKAVDIITTTDNAAIEGLVAGRQTGDGGFSGSYIGEVVAKSKQGPGRSDKEVNVKGDKVYSNSVNKVEWTLGKGKLNMGRFGFVYDVDRDYNFDKNWNKTSEGWDTGYALDFQGGTFNMGGKEWTFNPSVGFDYDTAENYTSDSKTPNAGDKDTKRLFKFNPKISTTYYGFATDISPIFAYDNITGTVAFQLDVTNFRKITDRWSTYGDMYLDIAGTKDDKSKKGNDTYGNAIFSGNIDDNNKYAFSVEQYLNYEREVVGNLYFSTEFGLEAYSLLQTTTDTINLYAQPQLQYRAHLGAVNVTPYVKYTAYAKTTDTDGPGRDELAVGVSFGTKF